MPGFPNESDLAEARDASARPTPHMPGTFGILGCRDDKKDPATAWMVATRLTNRMGVHFKKSGTKNQTPHCKHIETTSTFGPRVGDWEPQGGSSKPPKANGKCTQFGSEGLTPGTESLAPES